MESMEYINRLIQDQIHQTLERNKSLLLLGPRQTGKTTLIKNIPSDLFISFIKPETRLRYEKNPSLLEQEISALNITVPLIILDEVQKIPIIMDIVQDLIDNNKAQFILTGSSARKLKHNNQINLLPGRLVKIDITPFLNTEFEQSLEQHLLFGSLPGIALLSNHSFKTQDLNSYVTTYLEEEIRSEAVVRNLGSFARFLEYAASDSGRIINFRKLSQEIGVAHTTIASYFEILEDCLIIDRVQPITQSQTRSKLSKTNKYLFFDLGVRRFTAREGEQLPLEIMGHLFEQFVGLELLRFTKISTNQTQIKYWRDNNGPEIDWVIDHNHHYTPIEVKYTDSPSKRDAKHLKTFLKEYAPQTKQGYIICRTPRPLQIEENIKAVSWKDIPNLFTAS